jgi:hypothetical protein
MLSNICMRRFVKGWKTGGHEKRLAARIVNNADDFVICCRGTAKEAMAVMRKIMSKLKLTVNESKTRLCRLPEESFDFLGCTQGRNYDRRTGESYLGPRPSRKKIVRLCREISELTERRKTWQDVEMLIGRIDRKLRGWSSYFRIGTVSKACRNINSHTRYPVRRWLCAKFKEPGQGKKRISNQCLHQKLGLHQLQRTWRQRFVGERVNQGILTDLVRELEAGNPQSGSMSGVWKRSEIMISATASHLDSTTPLVNYIVFSNRPAQSIVSELYHLHRSQNCRCADL